MTGFLLKVSPVILVAMSGYLSKRIGLFKENTADTLLALVFYITLPALIIQTYVSVDFDARFLLFPLSTIIIILVISISAFAAKRFFDLPAETVGAFLIASMIINNSFVLPFVIISLGKEGLARLIMFDFLNGFMVFTYAYYIACSYGNHKKNRKVLIGKVLSAPPLWALVIGVILNQSHTVLPAFINDFLDLTGDMTAPLIMFSLGLYFNLKIVQFKLLSVSILLRMAGGFVLGLILVSLFNFEGIDKVVLLVGASAPVGYNTLTFAAMENLDKSFAASVVSVSVLIGIILTPLIIYFFK